MEKTIYTLKLFETLYVETEQKDMWFTRVPGGWVYDQSDGHGSPVFIPFNNEFQEQPKKEQYLTEEK